MQAALRDLLLYLAGRIDILMRMLIIPAIDLLDRRCVRLYKGDYAKSTVYRGDPVDTAASFAADGAQRIHLVDLNAARGDGRNNRTLISRIRRAVDVQIEVGGGIRSDRDVAELGEMGIDRLIVGTTLVKDPAAFGRWAAARPGRITAGIDAAEGLVKISGWKSATALTDTEAAKSAAALGAAEIIYTNIDRDGTLSGPDIDRCALISAESDLPVIVSGGVKGPEDFAALHRRIAEEQRKGSPSRLIGIITGKALYEGAFALREMIDSYAH